MLLAEAYSIVVRRTIAMAGAVPWRERSRAPGIMSSFTCSHPRVLIHVL